MFDTVLIANRGEIACRIIRTCRRMGIRAVAVYSDADEDALHVALADDGRRIGPPPSRDSYLDIDAVMAAARASGADAIHPGYGFLAENPEFAAACAAAGIVFIGPPVEALRAMGSKSAAKALMEKAGVPVLPGYHGDAQDDETLKKAAKKVGFPLMIKPSAGGGGRGMRLVERAKDFAEAVAAARREAKSSFADDRLLIERYLHRPRHIEVQLFADSQGNAVHLFERDCSIQRRHQKVIEEAPAPGLPLATRDAMGEAALTAAHAIDYVGAGTVEFLLDREGAFYFMEMNTRLQVEHPVTEMITGQDLVAWQIDVAAGGALPMAQDEIGMNGHAIEARLYAEDPARGFLPGSGTLSHLRLPNGNAHLRIDSGVREGGAVPRHYDPMIAKLIVHGRDRDAAIARLRSALAAVEIAGLATNAAFLARIAAHPAYEAADIDTSFIDRHLAELVPEADAAPDEILAAASVAVLFDRADAAGRHSPGAGDPHSPWRTADGWRLNAESFQEITLRDGEQTLIVGVHGGARDARLELPGGVRSARGARNGARRVSLELDGAPVAATVVRHGGEVTVISGGDTRRFVLYDPLAEAEAHAGETGGGLTAPMPGVVVALPVAPGAAVRKGAPLIVVEAMKVEHTIRAPADGTVESILFAVGDPVEEGAELVAFTPAE